MDQRQRQGREGPPLGGLWAEGPRWCCVAVAGTGAKGFESQPGDPSLLWVSGTGLSQMVTRADSGRNGEMGRNSSSWGLSLKQAGSRNKTRSK